MSYLYCALFDCLCWTLCGFVYFIAIVLCSVIEVCVIAYLLLFYAGWVITVGTLCGMLACCCLLVGGVCCFSINYFFGFVCCVGTTVDWFDLLLLIFLGCVDCCFKFVTFV